MRTMKKSTKVLSLFAISLLLYIGLQFNLEALVREDDPYVDPHEEVSYFYRRTYKNILYWNSFYGDTDMMLGLGRSIFESCNISKCYTTFYKDYLPIDDYDAIIFHGAQYHDWYSIRYGAPKVRNSRQIYIFLDMESPYYTNFYFRGPRNFYNWTMTYRQDSDVQRPYGLVLKKDTNYTLPTVQEIVKRPKKIAWFVSNCVSKSKRESLYLAINKMIPVEVYGKCGDFKCPRSNSEQCYEMIEKNYKFYLSFENSDCRDYATEKLFKILNRNIVPVVYGGADYDKIAPPHSVINVKDFKNVRELAKYLKFLNENPEEYLKFFEWKKHYVSTLENTNILCNLCKKLNEERQPKIYPDIAEWWRGPNFNQCSHDFIDNHYL